MATYPIFIEEEEIPEKKLSNNVSYIYSDGFLRVYSRRCVVAFEAAHNGDGFIVICERGKIFLRKMVPPQRTGALISWLLKFNKDNRATSVEQYERLLYSQRRRRYWEGYQEWEYKSQGYVFTLCNSPIDGNCRNVAGFISDAVTKQEVLQLVPLMNYHPDWYILKHLSERFGISEEEFLEARKQTFKPL